MAFATQWHGTRHHWAPVVSRFKNVALDLEDGRFAGEDLVGAEVDSPSARASRQIWWTMRRMRRHLDFTKSSGLAVTTRRAAGTSLGPTHNYGR